MIEKNILYITFNSFNLGINNQLKQSIMSKLFNFYKQPGGGGDDDDGNKPPDPKKK